jgi:hypothetical protein
MKVRNPTCVFEKTFEARLRGCAAEQPDRPIRRRADTRRLGGTDRLAVASGTLFRGKDALGLAQEYPGVYPVEPKALAPAAGREVSIRIGAADCATLRESTRGLFVPTETVEGEGKDREGGGFARRDVVTVG